MHIHASSIRLIRTSKNCSPRIAYASAVCRLFRGSGFCSADAGSSTQRSETEDLFGDLQAVRVTAGTRGNPNQGEGHLRFCRSPMWGSI